MAYNQSFTNSLKQNKSYNEYLNSGWAVLNTVRGKVTFNKVAFGVCALSAAWSVANLAAVIIKPQYSLLSFEGLKYGALSGLNIKLGYGFFKKMRKENAPVEEEETPKQKVK